MFELEGKYNKCKVFTDNADEACVRQLINLLNQKSLKGSKIRIMPDTHAGAGSVIGTTITIHDKVIPNLVGVDIGCGIYTAQLKEKRIDLPKLDIVIKKNIPSGGNIRKENGKYAMMVDVEHLRCLGKSGCHVSEVISYYSIGTLGGGNHFIEVDKDDNGNLYLVIHTGSRRLGKDVAEYYQKKAYEKLSCTGVYYKELEQKARNEFIETMKKEGKQKELSKLLAEWKYEDIDFIHLKCVPYELAYCEDSLFDDYIHDMKIVQEYAYWNRQSIVDTILKEMHLHAVDEFETIHNYIDTDQMILRKGAVSAMKYERILIPMNMRDGSLICIGKGNEDWNCSAPHGAGRLMSRSKAKENVSFSEFKKTMKEAGIYSSSVTKETIDESPFVYKPMDEIIENIKDTADIISILKPIYNFKASSQE